MTDQGYGSSRSALKRAEHGLEGVIFNSRWLMAPFYVGLIVSLAVLLLKFLHLLYEFITHAWRASESDVVLGVLSLIDVSLTASLVLIVVFSGYENFVSRIDPAGHPDWPAWMARIDFAGLKQKALASIVAISAMPTISSTSAVRWRSGPPNEAHHPGRHTRRAPPAGFDLALVH
jgi:uncharacterized protein (TIGR00645 family)